MPVKKTKEETLIDFKKVHGDKYLYDKFLEYTNNSQKIEIFCKEHSYYFNQTIRSHKTGIGCPKCGVKKCSNSNRKTTELFIEQSITKHGDAYSYEKTDYKDNRTKVLIFCNIHQKYFEQFPKDHINGCGCPNCGAKKGSIGLVKTQEKFLEDSLNTHGDKYDYSKVIYVNSTTHVDIVCRKHGLFSQTPFNHIVGYGCKKCGIEKNSENKKSDIEQVKEEFIKIHGDDYDYNRFTYYKNQNEPVEIFCKKHNTYFKQSSYLHKTGSCCPKCTKERVYKEKTDTKESFLEKVYKKGNIINISFDKLEYKKCKYKVIFTCKKHGDFKTRPQDFLNSGSRCPKCSEIGYSKAEKEIAEFIKEYVDIIESDRKILNGKELDILIPSLNTAIEFNGLYWHSDKHKHSNYHLDKTKNCLAKGIKLIHIFEDEWRDKKEIVKSRLLNIIGKTETKIFARQCEVRELESKTVSQFLDYNHIQGKVGGKVRLGLYYKEELVSLMTFGNLRKALGSKGTEQDFELLRFCNKLNTTVVGGASKLLKYFENNFDYKTITSYADRRWSEGNLYFNLGFELVSETKPNYFYTKGEFRENRFKYRKSELKEINKENRTEKQLMEELGYSRIYDSGTLKFKKEKPNV